MWPLLLLFYGSYCYINQLHLYSASTPWRSFSRYGIFERCRELVEAGFDVRQPDKENVTLLHWAAINNRIDLVKWVIQGKRHTIMTQCVYTDSEEKTKHQYKLAVVYQSFNDDERRGQHWTEF